MNSERVTHMPVDWLLAEGAPWVRYWTIRDLLGHDADQLEAVAAREEMLASPLVADLLAGVSDWPGPALKRHNDAGHPLHRLALLADLGLTANDPALGPIIERLLATQSAEGPFVVNLQVGEQYGGDGQLRPGWMACDAPTVLYALLAFGLGEHPGVQRALDHLVGLVEENGWQCVAARQLGGFRGPGRKGDPCPYATLIALKALSQVPALLDSEAARRGVEMLLWHWEVQHERKFYLFGIGTDFRKPRYPLIWYDILHVAEVLSHFPTARRDARFQALLGELMTQADDAGRFIPRAMYKAWAGWDFADKRAPSPTITAVAWRAWQRSQVP